MVTNAPLPVVSFTKERLFLDVDDFRQQYLGEKDIDFSRTLTWNIRGDFLTDLAFLNYAWAPSEIASPIVVYIGAGGRERNIALLSTMYPEIEWHLYDTSGIDEDPFKDTQTINARGKKNITLYQPPYHHNDYERWVFTTGVLLISRIYLEPKDKGYTAEERQHLVDMKEQLKLYKLINPNYALIRFRPPHIHDEVGNFLEFPYGLSFKTPYRSSYATHTMLLVEDKNSYVKWDLKFYDDGMYFHDTVTRPIGIFRNAWLPYRSKRTVIDPPELLDDYDSNFEVHTFLSFLRKRKYGDTLPPYDEVGELSKGLSKWLMPNVENPLSKLRTEQNK